MSDPVACPACGFAPNRTVWGEELCPGCLLRLVLTGGDENPAESPTWTRGEEAPTPVAGTEGRGSGFAVGQVLGQRYQIRSFLGKGGMGEVWRAYDLKLRVEVALKALKTDLASDAARLELLRGEVRAAREVTSPNVCRIYDLVELDESELVSMEYVDGTTLLDVMRKKSPMDPPEAQEIASQFLAGLEAIHQVGLVHRDVKPENIMVTRTGRVVLMDFGLARSSDEGAGSVSGTPAYMAPEQAKGEADARSDLFSAGVILAEMVSPDGVRDFESRQSVWNGIRSEPVEVPDSPWSPVVKKAVAKNPGDRFQSAHELTRALEEVAFRVHDETGLEPYPGLASFDEGDAEYFFGREGEVEAVWTKLQSAQLLGIIGASGAGKSSFIGAGLLPSKPDGWAIARCTLGNAALDSLRESSYEVIEEDPEAVKRLAAGGDTAIVEAFASWRKGHKHALLIVDQFEELFTQNSDEEQARCAQVLGRIAIDADVHVLLSMRDDFLVRCNRFDELQPIFSELTALDPPRGSALRRAVVQPALRCGYRFEDEELADEILAEVEGERGALPLLAFALARLWEKRDRENGLITRQAYQDIGGVGGALAGHAEELMERLGPERQPTVREIFRNLVTAQGTRAARDAGELLSVFRDSRDDAAGVLRALIDARLLTSYEVPSDDGPGKQRVEVIHESLLRGWPRLVRWQTQDADAVQLRDQLRQAAKTWVERDRPDDLVWTGSAYREFAVWRERYPGGLTELEEAFASAMTSLATRRRRRRRLAATAVVVLATTIAVVFAALWRRSMVETRRAEAQKLIALGQVQLDDYPTAALAHATSSLELADSEEARFLAMEALWEGPTAMVVNNDPTLYASFSPAGTWLVQSHDFMSSLVVISSNGHQRVMDHPTESGKTRVKTVFGGREDFFLSWGEESDAGRIALWSAPERQLLTSARPMDDPSRFFGLGAMSGKAGNPRGLFAMAKGDLVTVDALYPDGRHEQLGEIRLAVPVREGGDICLPRESGEWIGVVEGSDVSIVRISREGLSDRLRLGQHLGDLIPRCQADPLGRFLVTATRSGEVKFWDTAGDQPPTVVDSPQHLRAHFLSKDGSNFIGLVELPGESGRGLWIWSIDDRTVRLRRRLDRIKVSDYDFDPVGLQLAMKGPFPVSRLWSLGAPAGAEPILLRRGPARYASQPQFSPDGRWVATCDQSGLMLWPLVRPYAAVIDLDVNIWIGGVEFGPGGRYLATSADSTLSLWPLEGSVPRAGHVVFEPRALLSEVAVSPNGELFAVASDGGEVWIGGDDGEEPQQLAGGKISGSSEVVFSPDGRFVAALTGGYDLKSAVFRVWDVESSHETVVLSLSDGEFRLGSGFTQDGRLLTGTSKGVVAWNVDTGDQEVLVKADVSRFVASDDGRHLLVTESGEDGLLGDAAGSPLIFNLDAGTTKTLNTHGLKVARAMALDRDGTVAVTGDQNGIIRVGFVTGEEPHLLLGHDGAVSTVAIDPLGRWIASAGQDETVRLWPMPDLSKPPLHTLPRVELIAKLKTLTNLRVVRDSESATGWTLTHDPFPGWETVPTW